MKTNWQKLYVLWSVLSLGISCAADTHASQFTRRRQGFRPSPPTSRLTKLTSSRRSAAAQESPPGSRRVYYPPPPETPRSVRPGKPKAKIRADFAPLPDVSITCSVSDFVVRVKPSFYGLGADAEELRLGRSCRSNGVLRPYGDLLFTYPLTACDAVRQLPQGYLLYKFVLHYEPWRTRSPGRAHRLHVDLECRYPRDHHVHQLAVKPTWQTAVLRKRLKGRPSDFHIDLMDDSWREPAKSQVYQLGQTVNFQVSASHLRKRAKLYINSCYATPSGAKSFLKYTIIDNLGCMMDSKTTPAASQFVSRTDKSIRFSVKAFQFTADPDAEISVHCKLSVVAEDADPAHKSCTYRGNGWTALTADDSICDCCDSQCVTAKQRRAVFEGSASIGLLVSDQSLTLEDVGTRTEEIRISPHNDELHGWETVWETADVVNGDGKEAQGHMEVVVEGDEGSRVALGGVTEPGLDELGFRDWGGLEEWDATEVGSNEFGEHGPKHDVRDFMEGEEQENRSEGSEAEQGIRLNQNGEAVPPWTPLEQLNAGTQSRSEPHKAKEREENPKYTDERKSSDLADEMTWYFTWR